MTEGGTPPRVFPANSSHIPSEGTILSRQEKSLLFANSVLAENRSYDNGWMARERTRITVRGAVQGVGFRPFVHRLATELGLAGWVRNSGSGVIIDAGGDAPALERFLVRLEDEHPPHAMIRQIETVSLATRHLGGFSIRNDENELVTSALPLPDLATCPACRAEILDPASRRYRYPFTSCPHCGPRYSIIEGLPYDRRRTTMRRFAPCAACRREYTDPADRRFHAETIACPECGPSLAWHKDRGETPDQSGEDALTRAVEAIRQGHIVALLGLGGFQLIVDARNEEAVSRLRARKRRGNKPFALMVPHLGLASSLCSISLRERDLLLSPAAPIVVMERSTRGSNRIASSVAPGQPALGVMLPASPLHHLLMTDLGFPVVATSGNLSGDPLCLTGKEARAQLGGVAGSFLSHDCPPVRPVDDSVVRVILGEPQVLRRARGYAPLPPVPSLRTSRSLLALGGHLKNTIALSTDGSVILSQHLGDLESKRAVDSYRAACETLPALCGTTPDTLACDSHPDYATTGSTATAKGRERVTVQHHFANVISCLTENELAPPVLGIAWDGSGYGPDGTIWGGEFLVATSRSSWLRVAHFRSFALPGGEAAIREPRRSLLGLLYEISRDASTGNDRFPALHSFTERELSILRTALSRGINTPRTTSVGRLFDGVASLLGLVQCSQFEGEASMAVESAAIEVGEIEPYDFRLHGSEPIVVDWEPMLLELIRDTENETPVPVRAARFHATLAGAALAVAHRIGIGDIVLTGGCFQNRILTEGLVRRLRAEGFRPHWHRRVPPNDGGLALGQLVAAAHQLENAPPPASAQLAPHQP